MLMFHYNTSLVKSTSLRNGILNIDLSFLAIVGCKCCTLDHVVENGLHKTPPESTSFPHPFNHEEHHGNGRADHLLGASLDLHSEPQEDEWCGM